MSGASKFFSNWYNFALRDETKTLARFAIALESNLDSAGVSLQFAVPWFLPIKERENISFTLSSFQAMPYPKESPINPIFVANCCVVLVAWILRFINNVKNSHEKRNLEKNLTLNEIKTTEIRLIQSIQILNFYDLKSIPNVCVFKDEEDIVRVKTRITERIDTPNFLSPILLPSDCIFTNRLIEHFHVENYPAGTQLLLSLIREKYWILGGKRTVRKKFIPSTAAWWGGFWERIVGTLKDLLRRALGKAIFPFEELTTILCECEKVVNSRPLIYLSEDLQDLTPITPAVFLCDRPSSETTDLDMLDGNHLRKRLRFIVKMMKELRERFRKEYLGQLVQRHRQDPQSSNIKVGDIVLIGDDVKKRLQWPLARVMPVELIPGNDGLVSTVRVKTQHSILVRLIL
ncbi:integrase catalytic domain-containing protein [Trichonephila clavipes]|nr:integrase catalytic domain-containing protein [Trichonephila clavipes]